MAKGNSQSVNISADALTEIAGQISQIDEKLDAASGSQSAGKRSFLNSLRAQYEPQIQQVTEQLTALLDSFSGEELAGVFDGVGRALTEKYGDQVNTFVDEQIKVRKTEPTETLSAEEQKKLSEERGELKKRWTAVRDILAQFGVDVSGFPEPKRRTGPRGSSGPRTLSQYEYSVDGEIVGNSLRAVAQKLGGVPVADIKTAMEAQDLKYRSAEFKKEPPETWSIDFNGRSIFAALSDVDDDDEDDDEETVSEEVDASSETVAV